jgi:hypothetical protein
MTLNNRRGREVPLFVDDFTYEDIRTAAFDPITTLHDAKNVHPAEMNDSRLGTYKTGGFLVRPDTDGKVYMITLDSYLKNKSSLTGLVPQAFLGSANSWIECPVVKVFSLDDATYTDSTPSYINVALV